MNTNYKVVKLINGDNIICEAVEHIDETYIIKTPLRMEVVQDITSHLQKIIILRLRRHM